MPAKPLQTRLHLVSSHGDKCYWIPVHPQLLPLPHRYNIEHPYDRTCFKAAALMWVHR
jgi:hypothetical protein